MGRRVAHTILSDTIIDSLELSSEYSMVEIRPNAEWIGRSLKELNLRERMGINIVVVRSGDALNAMPGPDTVLGEDDVLLVVTREETLKKLR